MRQIEKIDLNIGQAYLSEWNESMAIRELIANAIDETNDGKIDIKRLSKDKWSITNIGNEIKPENFVINEGDKALFIKIYNNTEEWTGTEIILDKCGDSFIEEAKAHFLIYRENNYKVLDRTKYGDVLLENSKGQNGTIYLNGIKIAYENTFLYSYNIKIEEDTLKKGISRERCNLSREIYKDSLKRIINDIKSEEVLNGYYNKIIKTRDGSLSGELVYKDTQLRTIEYRLKNKYNLVIFPSERKVNLVSLYTELSLKEGITVISLLNKYYNKLKVVPELIESNIIADNYERTYTKVKIEELDDESKRYFNLVVDFVYDKIFNKVILNVILVKENIYIGRKKRKLLFQ